MKNEKKAIQDFYPEELAHCYGCGRLNENGLQLKSFWHGEETIAYFTPKDYHIAVPGYVYGGLIASLIDCHGTGTAALAAYKNENRTYDSLPPLRFVTASLQIDYLKPTPLGVMLEIKGKVVEVKGKKVISEVTIKANSEITARGKVVAVLMPEKMFKSIS